MSITEIKDVVKKVLEKSKFLYLNDVLEKTKEGWNLTYYIYGITTDSNFILFTKFSFLLSSDKTEIRDKKLIILYDLSCNYYVTDFDDDADLTIYLSNLFEKGYDKGDIRDISNFCVEGTDKFNEKLKNENKNTFISNMDFVFEEKVFSCANLIFTFNLASDSNKENKIYIKKDNKNWKVSNHSFDKEVTDINDVYSVVVENLY